MLDYFFKRQDGLVSKAMEKLPNATNCYRYADLW